jgi:hypothetical protein
MWFGQHFLQNIVGKRLICCGVLLLAQKVSLGSLGKLLYILITTCLFGHNWRKGICYGFWSHYIYLIHMRNKVGQLDLGGRRHSFRDVFGQFMKK